MALTGMWLEAWTIPGTTTGSPPTKKLAFVPGRGSWLDPVAEVGRGSWEIPAAFDRLSEIVDPDSNVYSMMRLRRPNGSFGGALAYTWLAHRFEDRETDRETDAATVTGPGLEALLQVGILPFDFPAVDAKGRSVDPHWQWGSEEDAVGFEERTGDLENWGAEEGSTNSWYTSQASDLVNEPTSFQAIQGAGADTGLWYFEFIGDNNSWIGRRFTTLHASRYNVAIRVKAASGVNYRVRSGPASAVFSGTLLSDFVAYKDGVGNGAFQTVTLEYDAYHLGGTPAPFTPGEAWIEVVNIDGAVATIQVDEGSVDPNSTSILGNGIGVDDWRFRGEVLLYGTKAWAHSGDWSMVYLPGADKTAVDTHEAYRVFDVTPGVTYTLELWVYHEEAAAKNYRLILGPPGTDIAEAFGDNGVVSVSPNTPTRLTVTGKVPLTLSRIEAQLYYWETSPPASETFIDDDLFYQGQGPMSWTDIVDQLLDDLALNHVADGFERLVFVKHDSWTSTLDSNGATLSPATVTYRADTGKTLLEVLQDGLETWGFEYELVDLETPVGDSYVELKIYNKLGLGPDTSADPTPALVAGSNVLPSEIVKAMPVNDVTFQGDDGLFVREYDQAVIDAVGALSSYEDNPDVLTVESAQEAAEKTLAEHLVATGNKVVIVESTDHATPYYHFVKGQRLRATLPPGQASAVQRVMVIAGQVDAERAIFEVDLDRRIFASDPRLAMARGLDRLLREFKRRRITKPPTSVRASLITSSPGGGAPSIVVAASDASARSKAKADAGFVCAGVADDIVIQEALDALPAGGRVLLTEGTFNCVATLNVPTGVAVVGMSRGSPVGFPAVTKGTRLLFTAVTVGGNAIALGLRADLTDLKVDISGSPAGFIRAISCGVESRISGVWVESDVGVGIRDSGGQAWITGCHIDGTMTTGIQCVSGGGVVISDTFIEGSCALGVTVSGGGECVITNCVMECDDVAVQQTGNATLRVSNSYLRGFDIAAVEIFSTTAWVTFTGCHILSLGSAPGIILRDTTGNCYVNIAGNTIKASGSGILFDAFANAAKAEIIGNLFDSPGNHGIEIVDSSGHLIAGNFIVDAGGVTTNTFDGINLAGDSNRNFIHGNRIQPRLTVPTTRYGINISAAACDDNVYVGNWAGPAASFGTGAYNDVGTGTLVAWPGAAAPQGDNFLL